MTTRPLQRPNLANPILATFVVTLLVALALYVIAKPFLPDAWHKPGSFILQPVAIAGALLLLLPFGFSLGKRAGLTEIPNRLFIMHIRAACAGMFLVMVHALASLQGPPLVLLACLLVLLVTGVFARVYLARFMAQTFAAKPAAFSPGAGSTDLKVRLANVIERKTALLKKLDAQADEALFSVTLKHWLASPMRALAYQRLAAEEASLIGARRSVPLLQAYWRPLHMITAWLFLAGLLAHVIVVTFFAGYTAAGGPIYWWHITAW